MSSLRAVIRSIGKCGSCVAPLARLSSAASFVSRTAITTTTSTCRGLLTIARSAGLEKPSLSARVCVRGIKTYRNKPSPKPIKTKSCVKKRIRVNAKGVIKFKRAGLRHNLGCKSPEKRARLNRKGVVRGVWARKMKKLLLI